jgi:uncharacterized surface protein with fasciclin (FAS1) repeats
MATFSSSSLIKQLSLTALIGLELTLAAPGFANSSRQNSLSDRSTTELAELNQLTGLEVEPQISLAVATIPVAQILVAQARQDIIDTATAEGSFQTLLQLLDKLGMTEDLRGYGRFTVFAPTDAAFAAMPPDIMERLSSDRDLMSRVLAYHVISAESPLVSDQIKTPVSLRTLERSEITITKRRGQLYVNSARVVAADIEASNGVIHAIDQVLIPDDLMSGSSR